MKKTKLVLKKQNNEKTVLKTLGSFDIGAKNLAVCILDRLDGYPGFQIRQWKLISLVSNSGKSAPLRCKTKYKSRTTKKEEMCGQRSTYWNPVTRAGYCKKHIPKPSHQNLELNIERYTTCRNITDFELNQNLIRELDQIPELWKDCDEVVVETQMRSGMKKITDMIFSYLVDRTMHHQETEHCSLQNVRKVSASKKLKIPLDKLPMVVPTGEMGEYDQRKNLAEKQCQSLLRYTSDHWRNYYSHQKKKDDLADSFLQGMYFLLK